MKINLRIQKLVRVENKLDDLAKIAIRRKRLVRFGQTATLTESYDTFISDIHRIDRALVRFKGPALFRIFRRNDGWWDVEAIYDLGQQLAFVFRNNFFDAARREYPYYRFSPVFRVFSAMGRLIGNVHGPWSDSGLAEFIVMKLNELVNLLRTHLLKVRKRYENFRRSSMSNFNNLVDGFDRLADAEKRVVAVRFDAYFKEEYAAKGFLDSTSLNAAQADFLACAYPFRKGFVRQFGDRLVGWARAFEHGRERGFHMHFVLFFRSQGVDDGASLVDQLASLWDKWSMGRGEHYSSNTAVGEFKYEAIGLIDLQDEGTIRGLQHLAVYMTLAGVFLKLGGGAEVFGMGQFPATQRGPGRPSKRPPGDRITISAQEAWRKLVRFL